MQEYCNISQANATKLQIQRLLHTAFYHRNLRVVFTYGVFIMFDLNVPEKIIVSIQVGG